jgi:gamma-glutamyl-gamma-aminobutyrate hydrolase PuuD/uncharacterized protein YjbI with pentapeptide repeats
VGNSQGKPPAAPIGRGHARGHGHELIYPPERVRLQGFCLDVRNLDFSKTPNLTQLYFRNFRFEGCDFTNVDFQGSYFSSISAHSCEFVKTSWKDSIIQNSNFHRCDFTEAAILLSGVIDTMLVDSNFFLSRWNDSILRGIFILRVKLAEASFVNTTIQNSFLTDSDLSYSCWNSASLAGLFILRGKLLEASFLNSSVQDSFLVDSDLIDSLLLNVKKNFSIKGGRPHSITRPIVGLTWNFQERGRYTPLIAKALRDNGMLPLKIEMHPKGIDLQLLEQEVQTGISEIKLSPPKDRLSIAYELLTRCSESSEIRKLKQKAISDLEQCDGLALPGGKDIQPEFYDARRESKTECDDDFRRSIVEFALLFQAHRTRTPTMGTCRGSQMINVYLGGTLIQDIDEIHSGGKPQLVIISESTRKDEFQAILGGNNLIAISSHHQAIDKIGRGLETVLEYAGIPKLLLTPDNLFIASQIHPEVYISEDQINSKQQERVLYQLFSKTVHRFSTTNE